MQACAPRRTGPPVTCISSLASGPRARGAAAQIAEPECRPQQTWLSRAAESLAQRVAAACCAVPRKNLSAQAVRRLAANTGARTAEARAAPRHEGRLLSCKKGTRARLRCEA